jgi:hypothetical protein
MRSGAKHKCILYAILETCESLTMIGIDSFHFQRNILMERRFFAIR